MSKNKPALVFEVPNFDKLQKLIRDINEANGWTPLAPSDWPKSEVETTKIHAIGTKLCMVHSEVSEAMEAVRKLDEVNFLEELADTVIRCLDIAEGLGHRLDPHILRKLIKNSQRGYRHGGKAI